MICRGMQFLVCRRHLELLTSSVTVDMADWDWPQTHVICTSGFTMKKAECLPSSIFSCKCVCAKCRGLFHNLLKSRCQQRIKWRTESLPAAWCHSGWQQLWKSIYSGYLTEDYFKFGKFYDICIFQGVCLFVRKQATLCVNCTVVMYAFVLTWTLVQTLQYFVMDLESVK